MQGTVASLEVAPGDDVVAGQTLVVLESMKMEHLVSAEQAGRVTTVPAQVGATVHPGEVLVTLGPAVSGTQGPPSSSSRPEDAAAAERADLADVLAAHALGLDHARPEAVERRHGRGQRTARENVTDLVDDGTFVEYGPLAVAAQRRRRDIDDLSRSTPADGLVGGVGRIEGRPAVVVSYDYTVLAGTQGFQNHRKKD